MVLLSAENETLESRDKIGVADFFLNHVTCYKRGRCIICTYMFAKTRKKKIREGDTSIPGTIRGIQTEGCFCIVLAQNISMSKVSLAEEGE